jgi:hypothetical protein
MASQALPASAVGTSPRRGRARRAQVARKPVRNNSERDSRSESRFLHDRQAGDPSRAQSSVLSSRMKGVLMFAIQSIPHATVIKALNHLATMD